MAKVVRLTGMARENLGDRPMKEITPREILTLLRKVKSVVIMKQPVA